MAVVVICLKICTFVVSKTTIGCDITELFRLWFAWKSVPLWYLKQPCTIRNHSVTRLWFAWKSVPLWYLKQRQKRRKKKTHVVICLKICTFVVSKTTIPLCCAISVALWFAWKSVPLWYLKQLNSPFTFSKSSCDLLENLYLCGI